MSTDKSFLKESSRHVAQSAGVIAAATLCSRILGFVRDVVIARLFGIYLYAQAFVVAFRIPNLFRDFLGEGAMNSVLVPVFSEYTVRKTKEEFWELTNVVLNLLLVALMCLTLLGILFSPVLVRLIAPGFIASPEKLAATVKLTRLIFPYILLVSLAAYSMGILNSLRHFVVPALAPCFLNISLIVCALFFGEGTKGLALGVLIGGFLQLCIQIPVLYKKGFRLQLFRRFRHPAAASIGKLMVPRVLSSCIYQVNNFVDSIFGSLAWIVGEGGVAVLYFAYRLIQFPLGVLSNSLTQALLPTLSIQALESDRMKFKESLSWGLRVSFLVMVPSTIGFMVLARPLVEVLFGGGRFDFNSVHLTSRAFFFYSIGLCAYAGTKVLQSCFFALKDTKTPTKVAGIGLIINIILNALLMFPLQLAGLALATSLSGINTFVLLLILLRKKIGGFGVRAVAASFMRMLAASLCMGVVCVTLIRLPVHKYAALALAIAGGAASYLIFCVIFHVKEIRHLRQWNKKT
ncbi:MAG: murein biosynthesis integral membrane protein MurJ [Candidatus Omnitrophica bacterium]|nr:murein biosynthesis integral membrane protein MurJ [Candidatus Omnitrophota bacterium]